jgi:hypothetical protein
MRGNASPNRYEDGRVRPSPCLISIYVIIRRVVFVDDDWLWWWCVWLNDYTDASANMWLVGIFPPQPATKNSRDQNQGQPDQHEIQIDSIISSYFSNHSTSRHLLQLFGTTSAFHFHERSRAVASPNPLLAPVMTTTFPLMFCIFESFVLLNVEVRLLHKRGAVARRLATHCCGIARKRFTAADDNRLGKGRFPVGKAARSGWN